MIFFTAVVISALVIIIILIVLLILRNPRSGKCEFLKAVGGVNTQGF